MAKSEKAQARELVLTLQQAGWPIDMAIRAALKVLPAKRPKRSREKGAAT